MFSAFPGLLWTSVAGGDEALKLGWLVWILVVDPLDDMLQSVLRSCRATVLLFCVVFGYVEFSNCSGLDGAQGRSQHWRPVVELEVVWALGQGLK